MLHFRRAISRPGPAGAPGSVWRSSPVLAGSPSACHPPCSVSSDGPRGQRWDAFSVMVRLLHTSMQSNTQCFRLHTTGRHRCPVAHSSDVNSFFFFTLLFFFFFRLQVLAEFSHHTPFCRAALFCCRPETGYLWLIRAKRSPKVYL